MAVVAVTAVWLSVSVATSGDVRDQPKVAEKRYDPDLWTDEFEAA